MLDVVNRTDQHEFPKLAVPGSRTHGVAERALDRREDGLTHRSLAVARPIDPRVVRVVDELEDPMLYQRSHAFFPEIFT